MTCGRYFGCRFNVSTTCCERRSKPKCNLNCMSHSFCGLLPVCEANSTFSKYYCHFYLVFVAFVIVFMNLPWIFINGSISIMQETMSNEHAMRFPFVGSAMLLSLFLLFKFLSKDLVNAVLTCYFFVLGIIALSYVLSL